jgi:hypothetical protein
VLALLSSAFLLALSFGPWLAVILASPSFGSSAMLQLGPITGNRFADACKAALKPHLRQRLALLGSHSTPLGNFATDAHGRLSFTPKDDPLRGR